MLSSGLSFADAVRLLGGGGDRAAAALDRLMGGLLLAGSGAGMGFAVALFDPAAQLARLSGQLVGSVRERLDGVSRFDRTQRLVAAHAVLVLAAYYEELSAAALPFGSDGLELSRRDQVDLAAGDQTGTGTGTGTRLVDLGQGLLRQAVPCPAPQWPYEVTVATITGFYEDLSNRVLWFVEGLAVWDRLDDTARRRAEAVLRHELPGQASRRYEQMYRQLAVEIPEFAFWAGLVDHQATRAEVRKVFEGLSGLRRALEEMASGRAPQGLRLDLARSHQARLREPIIKSSETPPGVRIPLLGEGYVNPSFRVAHAESAEALAEEPWWRHAPVRDDVQGFLVGHLTGPEAVEAPLLVLGQPGSGKSVLTRILAAQLPPTDFLVVRVSLREVPADIDLQAQIEYAVRESTGDRATWPELVRTAGDALPTVILDGFDELLQATGASQSDYLENVAKFQHREAEMGRPVAVIVTTRTAVADRARSVDSMVALRLEPFAEDQIGHWLGIWNSANADILAARDLRPLPRSAVLAHPQLASQPLLLLLLALYDADDNALQRDAGGLAESELYERLLAQFADREVRKNGAAMSAAAITQAADRELTRLSVIAFAMFNRQRQWATQAEVDKDLRALLGEQGSQSSTGFRASLTAAEIALGRFYFVHEAQATRDGARLRTYEFLHATFGEYLVARLVTKELADLAEHARRHLTRSRPQPLDDSFLYVLLSFTALTTRSTVVSFLHEQIRAQPAAQRHLLSEQLLGLFHQALTARHSPEYTSYQPIDMTVTGRHAAWAANLVLLLVLSGEQVTARELFPRSQDGVTWWRQMALLWRSQLSTEGWNSLVHALEVRREWDGNRRVIRVLVADGDPPVTPLDLKWTYNDPARDAERRGDIARWRHYGFEDLRRHAGFLCDRTEDTVLHTTEPFAGILDPAIGTVHALPDGTTTTPAHALLQLLLCDDDHLVEAYEPCLAIVLNGFLDSTAADTAAARRYRELVLRQLDNDRRRLPHHWLATTLQRLDLETLELRPPLAATVVEFGGAVPAGAMLVVRRAEVLRRQYALREDPLPPGREPVVVLRHRVGEEVMLERIASPDSLPPVGLASIALTCARDSVWQSRWKDAFDRVANVAILIDTPFSQSLDALLADTTGFRYAIEPLLDRTPLWAYVCAVDGFPPLVLPCTMTRAAALRLHTRKRTGGRDPVELPVVVAEPEAVLAMVHRVVAEESVIEHYL